MYVYTTTPARWVTVIIFVGLPVKKMTRLSSCPFLEGDLPNWLCNAYVEIRHLPREVIDASGAVTDEFDVEYDFINKLLRLGDDATRARSQTKRRHSSKTAAMQARRRRACFCCTDNVGGGHISAGRDSSRGMR